MSGIEMAVCFESIQPLIVILKSNDLDPFFNILQPSQSSWMARIAKWLDSAAAWWTPCAMPMWACNRDLTQIERGNTYDDSDDVCHCMYVRVWGCFCFAIGNYAVYNDLWFGMHGLAFRTRSVILCLE